MAKSATTEAFIEWPQLVRSMPHVIAEQGRCIGPTKLFSEVAVSMDPYYGVRVAWYTVFNILALPTILMCSSLSFVRPLYSIYTS